MSDFTFIFFISSYWKPHKSLHFWVLNLQFHLSSKFGPYKRLPTTSLGFKVGKMLKFHLYIYIFHKWHLSHPICKNWNIEGISTLQNNNMSHPIEKRMYFEASDTINLPCILKIKIIDLSITSIKSQHL